MATDFFERGSGGPDATPKPHGPGATGSRAADARSAYEKALEMAKDSETRKRIRRKLRARK